MGKITHKFDISFAAHSTGTTEEILKRRVSQLLSVMPKHTVFEGFHGPKTDNSNMLLSYDMNFAHPLFPDGSLVEVDTLRMAWEDLNGSIEQEAMFMGVRYFRTENKKIGLPAGWLPEYPGQLNGTQNPHSHDWKTYKGFTDVYDYCDCGARK